VNINALQQKLPNITLLILVPAMITALSLQTYAIFAPTDEALSNKTQATKQPVNKIRPTRKLKEYTLFGSPISVNTQPVVAKTENLPKTNLRLILRGVSASGNTDENDSNKINTASALIEGPDKETLKYSIGNNLPGNAKLRSVYEKRVVIERNGRLENLYFPDSKNIGIASSTQTTSASTKLPVIPQTHARQNFSRPAANLDTLSDQRKKEIKQRLQQLREKMKQPQ